MKRWVCIIMFMILSLSLFTFAVHADVGPKPAITIIAKNMPSEMCYMDLLIDDNDDEYKNLDDLSSYNKDMIEALKTYSMDGWRPALTTGTHVPMTGHLLCQIEQGKCQMRYGYMGVPDTFKIIVVTESNQMVVSNVIKRKAFSSTIYFDYSSGRAYERSIITSYLIQMMFTFVATILIEGLILLAFRFNLKKNYKPLLLINILTQVLLTIVVISTMITRGSLIALIYYFILEIVIVIIEIVLFNQYLKEHSKTRRKIFALTANVVSFIAGVINILVNVT